MRANEMACLSWLLMIGIGLLLPFSVLLADVPNWLINTAMVVLIILGVLGLTRKARS